MPRQESPNDGGLDVQHFLRLCVVKGIEESDLPALTGLSRVGLWKILTGQSKPHLCTAMTLADLVGVSIDEIVTPSKHVWREYSGIDRQCLRPGRWAAALRNLVMGLPAIGVSIDAYSALMTRREGGVLVSRWIYDDRETPLGEHSMLGLLKGSGLPAFVSVLPWKVYLEDFFFAFLKATRQACCSKVSLLEGPVAIRYELPAGWDARYLRQPESFTIGMEPDHLCGSVVRECAHREIVEEMKDKIGFFFSLFPSKEISDKTTPRRPKWNAGLLESSGNGDTLAL